jgi:hypothetical protein
MATDTRDQIGRPDNRALWTIGAIVVIIALAYAAYAAYYRGDNYSTRSNNTSVTGTTTAPNTNQ